MRYPPHGVRGVGSALARSSRWNRVPGYLASASSSISLFVQIESAAAVERVAEIAAVDGVDGIFVGPADLAASMGRLGQQDHPEVVDAVLHAIGAATQAGKPAGVNAFAPDAADRYLAAGAAFVLRRCRRRAPRPGVRGARRPVRGRCVGRRRRRGARDLAVLRALTPSVATLDRI